jgi:ribosome-binding protein aMBF1 (putative translation factor)
MSLTPEQSRAARGWLDWSQDDLAKKANVSLSTVRDFEKGRRGPIANNLAALEAALAKAGIRPLETKGKATGIGLAPEGKPLRAAASQSRKNEG